MSQIVKQSTQTDLITAIVDTSNIPATGLTFSSVTCQFRKEGQANFISKTLDINNFKELGNGFYTITFTAADLDTLGSFLWVVNGTGLTQATGLADVQADPAATSTVLPTCGITGQVCDLRGLPIANVAVSARLLAQPGILGDKGLEDDVVSTTTDAAGQFSLELVQLAQVEVFISKMNYRRVINVPASTTADLFTIP